MAAQTGVSERTIGNYERNDRVPDATFMAKLMELGFDVIWLLTDNGAIEAAREESPRYQVGNEAGWADFVRVPRYDIRASAGPGALVNDESIVDHLAFKRSWLVGTLGLNPEQAALIDVAGDSMHGTIDDGDLILLDTRPQGSPQDGIYVINLRGALHVKRLRVRVTGEVDVVSDNAHYGAETISGEQLLQLQIVGRVVWQGRRI